jgi:hypothetical protein
VLLVVADELVDDLATGLAEPNHCQFHTLGPLVIGRNSGGTHTKDLWGDSHRK